MRIGILGGTFDPIHHGHVYVAREVSRIFGLARVLFMVSYYPPHKEKQTITSPFHRYAMTVLGLRNEENLHACRWELDQRSSYTVTTLGHFSSESRQHQYCFIAGSDSLKEIHLWKDCGRLLREHCFLFVQRPGTEVDLDELEIAQPLRAKIQLVSATSKPSIGDGCSFLVTLKTPPISSTSIRERIGVGEVPSPAMISSSVLEYIQKHELYGQHQDLFEEGL